MQRIQGDGPRLPFDYKRPVQEVKRGTTNEPYIYTPIPTRTYELSGEWENGLPIYKEV